MVINFEVPRLDSNHVAVVAFQFNLKELLNDVVSVLEVGVLEFEPQSDEEVVVLVVVQTKAVSLEHLAVRHAAVANVDLRTFWVHIFASLDLKLVLVRHSFQTF